MQLSDLPAHATVIGNLRRAVEAGDEWRWLELSCSLAAGRGDEHSDIDVGVGHRLEVDELEVRGRALVDAVGPSRGVLVHSEDGWPDGILRFAVEYEIGVQLDLVVMPAGRRPGLPEGSLALVDKDAQLSQEWTPPVATATGEQAAAWSMLGWWALSNVAKYVRRGALFEAVEGLREARTQALRLFAVGRGIPYPSFGLTSLLDYEPFEVPERLDATYAVPADGAEVIDAAWELVALLDSTIQAAGAALGVDLSSPWADIARARLRAADPRRPGG